MSEGTSDKCKQLTCSITYYRRTKYTPTTVSTQFKVNGTGYHKYTRDSTIYKPRAAIRSLVKVKLLLSHSSTMGQTHIIHI
ncbi:hypothetical protein J6590_080698 [Homalodisca vitripennis]|nr:hypothetical protein J6590_080698 [Homalodisca vitripennis]